MLHHKTKQKLIKLKESGLTSEELRKQMEEMEVSQEDADILIDELYADKPPSDVAPDAPPIVVQKEEKKGVKKFDYENLRKDEFEAYNKYLASLPLHKMVNFEVYKVDPIIEDRYPGLPNTPRDLVGVRITNNKPIHATRVAPHTALEMNAQVRNTGRYYLLKQ